MRNRRVSIIIPAYNCEKYIERCLNSILDQTFNNIEVIVVDDGSTDQTKNTVLKICEKDTRVVLVEKSNSGPSASRNVGIDNATGDFLMFVDADDFIPPNAVEKMLDACILNKVQIVRCNFSFSDGKNERKNGFVHEAAIIPTEYLLKEMFFDGTIWNSVWGQIIERSLAKNVRFDTDKRIGEDMLFNFQLYKQTDALYYLNEELYSYFVNPESITKKLSINNIERNMLDTIDMYDYFYKENDSRITQQKIANNCVNIMLSYERQLANFSFDEIEFLKEINYRMNKYFVLYTDKKFNWLAKRIQKGDYRSFQLYIKLLYAPLKKVRSIFKVS